MDTALLDIMRSGRNKNWAETMINLEARKLINTANMLSASHLRDSITRIKFVQEIKGVIDQQFAAARRAKSDEECMACVKNLRAETESLENQDRMLRTKALKIQAKVELIRKNNKIVGYVISAVNIVLSGVTIFGGFVMTSTMGPIGVLAGATLIIDGINGLSKELIDFAQPTSHSFSKGIVADSVMQTAQFMGFSPKTGLAFYNGVTLGASIYSIFGLVRKPEAWRLFRWMPSDYYRKFETMSRPKLTIKIVGYGVKAKVIFDLLTTDNGNN
ncbi:DUF4225 domain-containing protein [Rosenbergiella epipactidis]|uniref:DUF4225 domain-containing protein n=1 Tax=Rosenbergiella epipactidis TaxID=1544694 RepID=UPI001F4DA723|nr:DUF4225 domain-containing protein [Rosenbergiella epipactidis]